MSAPKKIEHLELISSSARGANLYCLTTSAKLDRVMSEGWLDRFWQSGLRLHDRLIITASAAADAAEYATAVVLSNQKGQVRARLLP